MYIVQGQKNNEANGFRLCLRMSLNVWFFGFFSGTAKDFLMMEKVYDAVHIVYWM